MALNWIVFVAPKYYFTCSAVATINNHPNNTVIKEYSTDFIVNVGLILNVTLI